MIRSRWWVWLGGATLVACTARLGCWQLDRAAQKLALQAAQLERRAQPALDGGELAIDLPAAAQQWHRQVRMVGAWRPDATIALDNRPMGSKAGFIVVTPLLLQQGGAVLVQRGWLPRDHRDRARLSLPPLPAGLIVVNGVVAPPPGRLLEFAPSAKGVLRQNLDLDQMARETGLRLRPLSVLQTVAPAEAVDGLLRDWPQPAVDVQRHHGYAMQWFALSALTLGLLLWFQIIAPLRRRHCAPS